MDDTEPMAAATDTSHPAAAYTSSTPPDASPPTETVAELGERILAELGGDRTNRTLTRWLAHHTASLIDAADRARAAEAPDAETRATAARAAILQVWQHRSAWPHGWPPPRAAAIARLLDLLPDLNNSHWHQATRFSRLHDFHHLILATICDLATANGEDLEQGWLDNFGELLTPDEVTLLTRAATVPQRIDNLVRWWDDSALQEPATTHTATSPTTAGSDEDKAGHPLIALADAYRNTIVSLLNDRNSRSSNNADDSQEHDKD